MNISITVQCELFSGHRPLREPAQRWEVGRQEEERRHGTCRRARLRRCHEAAGKLYYVVH